MNDLHKKIMERALLTQAAPALQILDGGIIRPSTCALPAALEFELPWNGSMAREAVVRFVPITLYLRDRIRIIWCLQGQGHMPELDFSGQWAFHFDFFRPEDLGTADLRIFCALAGQELKTKHFELRQDGASL